MTQEYKENILKYMTGNLEQQTGTYNPQFQNIEETQNNLYQQIKSYFSSMVFYVDFIPSKNNKNQNLNYSVLAVYGTLNGQSDESGALVILDENYDIVEFIYKYTDDTLIGAIQCLNVDDEGNFYMVELLNGNYYVVDLNNIVLKLENQTHFQAVKKRSFQILNQYNWDSMLKVYRNNGGSKYFILGRQDNSGTYSLVGISCEVTDQFTWIFYTTTYDIQKALATFNNGIQVYWDNNDELHFNIAVNYYGLIMLSNTNSNIMAEKRYTSDNIPGNSYCNFIFYSNEMGYYATIEDLDPVSAYKIYRINLNDTSSTLFYQDNSVYNAYNQLWLFKNNNAIYYTKAAYNGASYDLYFGLIDNIASYEQVLGDFTAGYFLEAYCYSNIINQFNRNYVYIQNQNTLYSLEFLWNDNNYNGPAFTSYNSLVPNLGTIEDENEHELINKNLYNVAPYSNRYTATLQIPNYFLNNEQLYNALLYSKNNNILSDGNIDTTKNIYEELYINFINQFNIINVNRGYNNIFAATYLVNSMLENKTDAYISKYVINYKDETTITQSLATNELTYSDLTTTLKFMVYVDKEIESINLISEDEQTIYNSIDCSLLEVGKYYLITQDIRIE